MERQGEGGIGWKIAGDGANEVDGASNVALRALNLMSRVATCFSTRTCSAVATAARRFRYSIKTLGSGWERNVMLDVLERMMLPAEGEERENSHGAAYCCGKRGRNRGTVFLSG